MSAQFAMLVMPSSIPSVPPVPARDGDAVPGAGLAGRVLSGPGLWLDWLEELDRASLLEELLADGVIAQALEEAPHGHCYDRTLTAKMTVTCVLVACLFPGAGYDAVLATAFGLPGLHLKPGTGVPTGPAFSKARALLGEQVMRRLFELDAARSDADPGIARLWKGLEVTALDGTTIVRGRAKVSAGGRVEVPGFGQLEVPVPCTSCRQGGRALDRDGDGVSQSSVAVQGACQGHEVFGGSHGYHRRLPSGRHVPGGRRDVRHHA